MTALDERIEQFMQLGKPRQKMFLRWHGRESFFDSAVQGVLEEMHPLKFTYEFEIKKWMPIEAWKLCDQFALSQSQDSWAGLMELFQMRGEWASSLLHAIFRFYRTSYEASRNPSTTLDHVRAWRNARWDDEYSRIRREQDGFATGSSHPIEKTPAKYLEGSTGNAGKIMAGAARKAVHDENARRDKIMRHWAECWLVHLGISPCQSDAESVTNPPAKQ